MKKTLQPSTADADVVVLGIDPGTLVTGYGVVVRRKTLLHLLECGTIVNSSDNPMPGRLERIHSGLSALIRKHRPDEVAIESAFYGKNAQSALKLGHARGVSLLAAVQNGVPTAEYSPREIKKSVVGRGNASKEQVRFMVKALLQAEDTAMVLDSSDALAIAICHLQRRGTPAFRVKNWKSFITAHPERVRQ
jgi:crossover junction endodeoxyribonuclease RuvC